MLSLTRRKGESLYISPADDLPPDMTVEELFKNGPIKILFGDINRDGIRFGIEAPKVLTILREELVE